MLLAGHAFDGGALLVPDGAYVEQDIRRPAALLGLMRLEQEYRLGAKNLLLGVVAVRLRDDSGVLRKLRDRRMVVIVNVAGRMRQHESGMKRAVEIDEAEQRLLRQIDRVIAKVPALDVGGAEDFSGVLGFFASLRL